MTTANNILPQSQRLFQSEIQKQIPRKLFPEFLSRSLSGGTTTSRVATPWMPALSSSSSSQQKRSIFSSFKRSFATKRGDFDPSKLRNVAIIAHVDHGKTTLVDEILKQSGMQGEWQSGARHLDSNDLERERGITILSKVTRINAPNRGDMIFNIVDTPGHADFGGEVERVLSMVEGVVLLVDAAEGPKTQTRFVLQKALQISGIKPLVVINKIDKPQRREKGDVENEIFDLFCALEATEDQLDYPTLYASGKNGWCCHDYQQAINDPPNNMDALFETIEKYVKPPETANDLSILDKDFTMLVSQLDMLPQLGCTITGKVSTGVVKKGDKLTVKNLDGTVHGVGKVKELTVVRGTIREKINESYAGDLVSISTQGVTPRWTQTLMTNSKSDPIISTQIDRPVIAVKLTQNNSPVAGKEGRYFTLFDIGERLKKEILTNVAIQIKEAENKSSIEVHGRGELQLGILIEEMRREGYEMTLSPPKVVTIWEDGIELEPWELIDIEVPENHAAAIVERMGTRGCEMKDMTTTTKGQTRMIFETPSRLFFGMRSWLTETTGGNAVVTSELLPMRPRDKVKEATQKKERNGVFVAGTAGMPNPVDYTKLAQRARLFIPHDKPLYVGQLMGEMYQGKDDIDVGICKPHDGYQTKRDAPNPRTLGLEEQLTYIESDECLEITPARIVMRKMILDPKARAIQAKNKAKASAA